MAHVILTQPIARIVTRGDGVFVGKTFRDDEFDENTVYELGKCRFTGNIILRKLDQSVIAGGEENFSDSPIRVHWAQEIGTVLKRAGRFIFWTRKEYIEVTQNEPV